MEKKVVGGRSRTNKTEQNMSALKLEKVTGWIAVTVGSTLLGAVVTTVWNSGRPQTIPLHVDTDLHSNRLFYDSTEVLPIPAEYASLCNESNWASSDNLRESSIRYYDLMESFSMNREKMNGFMTSSDELMPYFRVFRQVMAKHDRGVATRDDYDEFYNIWERHGGFIWGALKGEFNRGNYHLEEPDVRGERIFRLFTDKVTTSIGTEVELYLVSNGGAFSTFLNPVTPRDMPCHIYGSLVLAHFDTKQLRRIIDVCEKDIDRHRESHRKIIIQIEEIEKRLSRILTSCLVHNSGATPFVVLPAAKLRLHTKGQLIDGVEGDRDLLIAVEARNERRRSEPIQVNGGAADVITFYALQPIMNMDSGDFYMKLLNDGRVNVAIELSLKGGGVLTPEVYETDAFPFAVKGSD